MTIDFMLLLGHRAPYPPPAIARRPVFSCQDDNDDGDAPPKPQVKRTAQRGVRLDRIHAHLVKFGPKSARHISTEMKMARVTAWEDLELLIAQRRVIKTGRGAYLAI